MSYELYYANNSHESEAYHGEYETIDWDTEGCEVSIVGEFETWDAAITAADDFGVGVYLISEATAGRYTHAIRVAPGSAPETRSC